MDTNDFEQFVNSVKQILSKNGYPANRVSLPLERMYEAAHGKGLNFNKVLDRLRDEGVDHEKTGEKIVFFTSAELTEDSEQTDTQGFGTSEFANLDLAGMQAKAAQILRGMSPEQLEQLRMVIESLSPEEREELTKKAMELTQSGK